MDNQIQVLVAGAGPTGLMAALELTRRGIAVRVIDKLASPSPYSRALVVHAKSLELFQNLGLDRAFLAAGFRTIGVSIHVDGRHAADVEIGDIAAGSTPFPFVLFISQAETERILARTLADSGIAVERAVELTEFSQDADGVTTTLMHAGGSRETVRCAYLIGADGAHSVVRHRLGLSFEGGAYEQDFALADVRIDWSLPRDRLMLFLSSPGLMAAFPLNDGTHRLITMVPPGFTNSNESLSLNEVQTLARCVSGTSVSLSNPVWLSRFRLHHRGVDRYGVGRVFVAGDAAHIHSPAGGQGMNTGIQDAANLAWKLALTINGQAGPRLLESYNAERLPIGRVLLKSTDRMFELAATGNRFVIALRNFLVPRLMPLMLRYDSLRQRLFRFISQLGIHYRGSPIVLEVGRWRGGPAPGERAPNASVHDATTIFELLRGTEHCLLIFTGKSGESDSWCADVSFPCCVHMIRYDTNPNVHNLYGVSATGGAYLIRPDGYVGARAPLTEIAGMLRRYTKVLS